MKLKLKRWIGVMLVIALAVVVFQPAGVNTVEAASLSQIKKDLAAAKREIAEAEKRAADAETHKKEVSSKIKSTESDIKKIMSELDNVVISMTKTQTKIDETEAQLLQAGQDLEDAEARIVERDELLQSRMRLMYTNGFVSYIEVLLSSTSFSDFLDRFDALQAILSQDREILEEHKKDKELVVQKKQEIEKSLVEVKEMYTELEEKKSYLVKAEAEKERMILSYNDEIEQLEEISEEQEKLLIALAAKVAKLNAEQKRIENPYSGGKLAVPLKDKYRISSEFGTRIHPITGKKHTHTGLDMAAPQGTPIYAAASGVVIVAQTWSGYGNTVIIDHGNGLWTLYGHIRNGGILVEKGDTVKVGEKIAEVGSTGNSTGPHLHFEVRKNEVAVNPASYLK